MIGDDIKQMLKPELLPGERLIWTGQPQRVSYPFHAILMCGISGLFLLIGTITFLLSAVSGSIGLALFMFAWTSIAGWNFYVGQRMIFSPMLQRYGISNQRVLIVQTGRKSRLVSIRAPQLGQIEKSGGENIGTLAFGTQQSDFTAFAGALKPSLDKFMNIENPRRVEKLILKTLLDIKD